MDIKCALEKGILKSKGFSKVINELKDILIAFNDGRYLETFEVTISTLFKVNIVTECREEYSKEIHFQYKFTVRKNYRLLEANNLKKFFAKAIAENLNREYDFKVKRWQTITEVAITDDYFEEDGWSRWQINNIKGWADTVVGIYHIEQECGEHWLIIAKNPNSGIQSTVYNLNK